MFKINKDFYYLADEGCGPDPDCSRKKNTNSLSDKNRVANNCIKKGEIIKTFSQKRNSIAKRKFYYLP